MTASTMTLGAYNMESENPQTAARFWSALTGGTAHPGGESVYIAPSGEHGFALFIQPFNEPRPSRQSSHLDLTVPWGQREAEVARAVSLGAVIQWHVLDEHPHVQWTTLADPEGTLFCLAEHPPAAGQ